MVSFDKIPGDVRVPFVYVEVARDPLFKGSEVQEHRVLLIGERLTAGATPALTPFLASSADVVRQQAGAGSILHRMALAYFAENSTTELWCVGLSDGGAGKAGGEFQFTGTATANGTLALYIGGERITYSVLSGDTNTAIATGVAAAINADTSLPVTASAATGTVTVTAKTGGAIGNVLDLRANYYTGEVLPAGVSLTVVAMSGGSGYPDVSTVWPVLGDTVQYNTIACAVNDSAALSAIDTELERRDGPLLTIDGRAILALSDTHANLVTAGGNQDSKHFCLVGQYKQPRPTYEVAACVAGEVAASVQRAPGQSFQRLQLSHLMAPAVADQFTLEERDVQLHNGISTLVFDAQGRAYIERLVTTYQSSPSTGAPDDLWLDLVSGYICSYVRYSTRVRLLAKYPRHKLADDGTKFAAGQAVVTPSTIKGEMLSLFRTWERMGLVENLDQFKADLVVERDATDPNRLNILAPPDWINHFRVGAVKLAPRI